MVKLRNDVDLKELEKYGFVYNDEEGKYFFSKNKNTITINVWNRKIELKQQKTGSHECLEILCNLTKDGLVIIEKIKSE